MMILMMIPLKFCHCSVVLCIFLLFAGLRRRKTCTSCGSPARLAWSPCLRSRCVRAWARVSPARFAVHSRFFFRNDFHFKTFHSCVRIFFLRRQYRTIFTYVHTCVYRYYCLSVCIYVCMHVCMCIAVHMYSNWHVCETGKQGVKVIYI